MFALFFPLLQYNLPTCYIYILLFVVRSILARTSARNLGSIIHACIRPVGDVLLVACCIFSCSLFVFLQKTEWMTTTCPHTLMCIVDVFSQYFDVLAPVLLDNLYSQFSWSAQQGESTAIVV